MRTTTITPDSDRGSTWFDPAWKDWGSMLFLALAALMLPYGCGPAAAPTGLHKHLVGRWEKDDGTKEIIIVTEQGDFIKPGTRSEKKAQEIDGYRAEFGIGDYDVTVTKAGKVIGAFNVEFNSDNEIRITKGEGTKLSDLRGAYRRVTGSGAGEIAPGAAGKNSLAAKLPPLKVTLGQLEGRRKTLQSSLEKIERQRLDLLPKLRAEGLLTEDGKPSEKPVEDLSAQGKLLRKEWVEVLRDMKAVKAKRADLDTTIAKASAIIRTVERQVDLEQLEINPEDAAALDNAEFLLADVKDRLDGGKHDSVVDQLEEAAILDEQFKVNK